MFELRCGGDVCAWSGCVLLIVCMCLYKNIFYKRKRTRRDQSTTHVDVEWML